MARVKHTVPKKTRTDHCGAQAKKVQRGIKKTALAGKKCQHKGPAKKIHGH